MKLINHIHEYERSISKKEIYRCIHPECHHYTRREYIVGKKVLCSVCHEPMIARQEQLLAGQNKKGTKRLTCVIDSRSPRAVEISAVGDFVNELLKVSGE